MTPVFMIGTQRSGSNLLRLMLNQLRQIASPHPPHILERMLPLIDCYGDLNISNHFNQLVEDVCKLINLNPVEWEGVKFNHQEIVSRCKEKSLMSVYEAVHDIYAENQGAETWCCKSLANINYVDEIEAYFNKPLYIYLYRDGRDVALSFQKAVVGEKHIYNIASEWAETQALAIKLKKCIEPSRFFSISYEQLTMQPVVTARALCNFLSVKYTDDMLAFYQSNEARNAANSSELWGNVGNPVIKNNTNKFLSEMNERNIEIFESVAGRELDQLGYERYLIQQGMEMDFSTNEIEMFSNENNRLKLQFKMNMDESDMNRRKIQSKLLTKIKSRNVA
jgi:Sulfotransferase family